MKLLIAATIALSFVSSVASAQSAIHDQMEMLLSNGFTQMCFHIEENPLQGRKPDYATGTMGADEYEGAGGDYAELYINKDKTYIILDYSHGEEVCMVMVGK